MQFTELKVADIKAQIWSVRVHSLTHQLCFGGTRGPTKYLPGVFNVLSDQCTCSEVLTSPYLVFCNVIKVDV